MGDHERILRASEIGEYVFCHRAWWLHRVQGLESANRAKMLSGVALHSAHGQVLERADRLQKMGLVLLALAVFLVVACMLALVSPVP
ncbi:MAG: hypothetical protein ACM3S0_13500 [Acidobacteriota bacterium]